MPYARDKRRTSETTLGLSSVVRSCMQRKSSFVTDDTARRSALLLRLEKYGEVTRDKEEKSKKKKNHQKGQRRDGWEMAAALLRGI